jgi:titin
VERADDINGVPGTYAVIATIPTPDTVSYVDETVAPKTTYWYRVAAYNVNGSSVYSNAVSVVTLGEIPQAPANLRVTAATKTTLSLAWDDRSTNELGFYMERSSDGLTFTRIATLAANVTTYLDQKLKKGTTYWYRVQAFNADGVSAYSNVASGTTTWK